MKTLFVNQDLYQLLINFAEENFAAFEFRSEESVDIEDHEDFEAWFEANK